jgi:2-C-methyl-D-erythritol 4-phosphate cytidylyltransferase
MIYTSVIIVAAGKGKRMNMKKSKQFIEIDGEPIIVRTIKNFQENKNVNEIIMVVGKDEIEYYKNFIKKEYQFNKISKIVEGGKERQESVYNGIKVLDDNCEIVMIHDGARPFINEEIINDAIKKTCDYMATVVAVPVKDTIKTVDNKLNIDKTLDRNILWAMQTPQTFKKDIIIKAHKKAIEDNFNGTDDAVLVEQLGIKVKLVRGNYYNIKITTKEDLVIGRALSKDID